MVMILPQMARPGRSILSSPIDDAVTIPKQIEARKARVAK